MAGASKETSADLNLLFAFLALQMSFIDRDQLLQAMSVWVNNKSQSLGDILSDKGFLSPERFSMLQELVQEHLRQNDNDPEKSLEAFSSMTMSLAAVRNALGNVGDADIEHSLARMSPRPGGDALETQHMSSLTAASLGSRFRVLRPHAKGGLGQVSVARDDELNREVALKEIQPQFADDQMSRGRFVLEAEITGGLEHPGIVPVYGMGAHPDGRPYYAMRFIRGDSLKDAISRFHKANQKGRDPGEQILQFRKLLRRFIDVCYAMDYAHSRHVLHRDLKPGNIMLGKYGETMVVDWGMAKVVDVESEEPSIDLDQTPITPSVNRDIVATSMGSTVGTPPYMSPEQAAGRLDRMGPASDIYGLGATMFHLLTGRPPFRDKDVGSVLSRVQAGDFEPPREVDPSVPKPLEAICLKAMSLDAQRRYATSSDLAEDIEHWLADEPVSACSETFLEKSARWLRRNRTWARAIAASLLIITAVSVAAAALINQARSLEAVARQDAEDARDDAREQRDFAVHRLRDARAAIDKWVTGGADALKYYDIFQGVRTLLLQEAIDDYEALTEQKTDMEELEMERGRAFQRLGKTLRMLAQSTTSDDSQEGMPDAQALIQDAQEAYQRSLELFRLYPDSAIAQFEVANTHNLMGELYADVDLSSDAESSYHAAIDLLRPIAEQHPDQVDFSHSLGNALFNLGVLHRRAHQGDAAQENLRAAVDQLDRLVHKTAGANQFLAARAKARLALGRALLDRGAYQEALQEFELAQQDGEQILRQSLQEEKDRPQQDPDYVEATEILASASLENGTVLGKLGRDREQAEVNAFAIDNYRRLTSILPHVLPHRENLAVSLYSQGELLKRQGETRQAAVAYNESGTAYDYLRRNHQLPRYREGYGIALNALAILLSDHREDENARQLYQEAVSTMTSLAEKSPQTLRYQERQAIAQAGLAHVIHKLAGSDESRLKNAQNYFLQAQTLFDQLIEAQPQMPRLHDSAAVAAKQFGQLYLDLQDEASARAEFARARSHWESIVASESPAADQLNRFAMYLLNTPLEDLRDPQSARSYADQALQSASDNPAYWVTKGIAEYRAGKWAEAADALNKALELRDGKGQGPELFFLAMTLWEQAAGPDETADQHFQAAVKWTEQNRPGNVDLQRIANEATEIRKKFAPDNTTEPAEEAATP